MLSPLTLFRLQNRIQGVLAPEAAAKRLSGLFFTPRRLPTKPWQAAVARRAVRHQLRVNLSALVFGYGPKKVILLHGWEGNPHSWNGLIDRLPPDEYTVIALDGPAHGASAGSRAHVNAFAKALIAADAELGPFHAAVGHSMGGAATLWALSLGLRAERVATLAAPASLDGVLRRYQAFARIPNRAMPAVLAEAEAQLGIPISALEQALPNIRVPVVVVQDADDAEVPLSDGEAHVRAIPGAQWHPTAGLGHRGVLRDAAVLDAVAAFIRNDGSKSA